MSPKSDDAQSKPETKPEPEKSERTERPFEVTPTVLDERTHAEMLVLYRESVETIRFAKHQQWWTVGSTLVVFFAFIAIANFVAASHEYAKILTALTIFFSVAGIFALIMYQFWQHNEKMKIVELSRYMSNLWRRVRKIKSRREADLHRYTLLLFMIITIVIGGVITYFGVQQVADNVNSYARNPNVTIQPR